MHFALRWMLLLPLLVPVSALAEPIAALRPMAFLAGHCWRGAFPDGKRVDEHCFIWLLGGRALRDTHVVRAPGQPDYVGESTYYWDPGSRRVEFIYLENAGGLSRGTMESTPEALVFPPTKYVGDGEGMTYRARWSLKDGSSYEAWSEAQGAQGWTTMWKVLMKRVD